MQISEAIQKQVGEIFEPKFQAQICNLLERYGSDTGHREVEGIHASILKLASGDPDRVAHLVEAALRDYRDIFYWLTFDEDGDPPPLPTPNVDRKLILPPGIPEHLQNSVMSLVMYESPELRPREIARDPSLDEIRDLVYGLTWQDITFVVLQLDGGNWLEGSGSLKAEDGLSARCSVEGVEYVSATAPDSLDALVELLQSFVERDGQWRTMIAWS